MVKPNSLFDTIIKKKQATKMMASVAFASLEERYIR